MPEGNPGGYRRPRNPAPASGPGSLSQRTDGQPLRAPTGMDYGERQQLMAQQRARRLPEGEGPPQPQTGQGQQGGQAPPASLGDVFQPTERPGEPPTSGANEPQSMLPEDPDEFARALFSVTQTEDLRRLLEWRENRMMPQGPR